MSSEKRGCLAGVEDFEHPVTHEEFRRLGHAMVDAIADYRESIEMYPVRSEVEPGYLAGLLPAQAPRDPETMAAVMADVDKFIMPGITHWQHPNFFAYFPANSSYPALLGDMLSTGLGVVGFSWVGSPAATELETITMDWLASFFGLPQCFLSTSDVGRAGGVIQGTASEACLVALLAARARKLSGDGPAIDPANLVAYTTDQAHSCVKKACMIAGIEHLRFVPARASAGWALSPADVDVAMAEDRARGLTPFFITTLIGTTSTAAVDPVGDVADVARKYGAWTHVDAAYAGVFSCLPDVRGEYFQHLEKVDSFATNPHKSMLISFDCSALWVRDADWLRAALSLHPRHQFVGLRHAMEHLDYKDWQVPLGRRFRALKIWLVLRMYGTDKIKAYLQHHLDMAGKLADLIAADDRFEIVAPPRFALVCFRMRDATDEESERLLQRLNTTGRAFLVHTVVGGRHAIRFAIGSIETQWRHVADTWQLVQNLADEIRQQP